MKPDNGDFAVIEAILELICGNAVFNDVLVRQDDVIKLTTPAGLIPAAEVLFGPASPNASAMVVHEGDVGDVIAPLGEKDEFSEQRENWSTCVTRAQIIRLFHDVDPHWETTIRAGAIDRPMEIGDYRVRCSLFSFEGGKRIGACIRRHPLKPIPLEKLNLPYPALNLAQHSHGLVIVIGGTGAGKTTTIAAYLDQINRTREDHIVTVEDPVEILHEDVKSTITSKEVGRDVPSITVGLTDALRQKPDTLMLSEVRSREAADMVFRLAESRHQVFTTMHARSPEGAIAKLIGFFPADEQESRAMALAQVLLGIVMQARVPNITKDGYLLACEVLINTPEMATLIADRSRWGELRGALVKSSDCSEMNKDLRRWIEEKQISEAVGMRASHDPIGLKNLRSAATTRTVAPPRRGL